MSRITKYNDIEWSIDREICRFDIIYGEPPSVVFMSEALFKYLLCPHNIIVSSDKKFYFHGIEVKLYYESTFEYYLAGKTGTISIVSEE